MKTYVKPIKKDIYEYKLFIYNIYEDLHEDRNKDTVQTPMKTYKKTDDETVYKYENLSNDKVQI